MKIRHLENFQEKLDELETRILILRSENAAVDQAASLIMTAREGRTHRP